VTVVHGELRERIPEVSRRRGMGLGIAARNRDRAHPLVHEQLRELLGPGVHHLEVCAKRLAPEFFRGPHLGHAPRRDRLPTRSPGARSRPPPRRRRRPDDALGYELYEPRERADVGVHPDVDLEDVEGPRLAVHTRVDCDKDDKTSSRMSTPPGGVPPGAARQTLRRVLSFFRRRRELAFRPRFLAAGPRTSRGSARSRPADRCGRDRGSRGR
jgi:hypothetical protein